MLIQNACGRWIPEKIDGLGELRPYEGVWTNVSGRNGGLYVPGRERRPARRDKVAGSLREAIERVGLRDGMTISFHHHLRDGDDLVNQVLDVIAEMGIRDLTLFPSSLTNSHQGVVGHIESGVVSRIYTSGARGAVGQAISAGKLKVPTVIRSHGGRARAISSGEVPIDVAFIAAPTADKMGNMNGVHGPSACGSLGYAMVDARYARSVVAVTDNLVDFPANPISIPQIDVDYVVQVARLGDPAKIGTGTTRMTRNPVDLIIAAYAARAIQHSGHFKQDYVLQTGAGGASLAVAANLRDAMLETGVRGSFIVGGTTSYMVQMLQEGLFRAMFDVQGFDAAVVGSLRDDPRHIEIDASYYANPFVHDPVVNMLDVVILGALEVDVDFNVNVLTGSSGLLQGASGGHCDTAAGASLTVVVLPSFRARMPMIRDRVVTITTPGETTDLIVTERGIAVNPRRPELRDCLTDAGLPVVDIHDLKDQVERLTGHPREIEFSDEIVGLVEYRDGTIIDTIRKVV